MLVSDDGRLVLERAEIELRDGSRLVAKIDETDDLGIWIEVRRRDGVHILLVRWEYVLTLEFPKEDRRPFGLGTKV
jgi:hypothetical protein